MKKGGVGGVLLSLVIAAFGVYLFFNGIGVITGGKTPASTQPPAAINEFITNRDGVAFCVTKVENLQSVGSGYFPATTENNFVVVTITIFNNGTEPYDVNSSRFVLMNGEIEYEDDTSAALSVDNGMFMDTINPGLTKEYVLAYETPMTTQECDFQLKIKYITFMESESVYISLAEAK